MCFKELKVGDKIYVKFPQCDDWQEETVKEIMTGETDYKGSGHYYMRIFTDRTVNNCTTEEQANGNHWPILLNYNISLEHVIVDAAPETYIEVSTVKVTEVHNDSKETIDSLIKIINNATLVDLRKKELLPEEAHIVGMSNHHFEHRHLYNMNYCYGGTEYGGYTWLSQDEEPHGWWTMNHNVAKFRREYMFIVPDRESGTALAKLLNLIGNDWLDFESAINSREKEIAHLTSEINLIKSVEDSLKEKVDNK